MYIISLITGIYYTLLSNLILFLIGYLSMFYSIVYFSEKYTKINKILAYIIATGFSFIYLAYPFFGSTFEAVFDSFLPLLLVLFDKFFTEYNSKPKNYMVSSIFIMTAIASLAITDFRTIVYVPALFILFFIYYNIINHSFKYFKKTLYMTLYAAIFLVALELRYFISIYLISHVGTSALGSTVSLQFFIAYMSFPLLNSIGGNIQWYTTYSPDLVFLALIPFLLILIALRFSKGLKILKFMFLLLLAFILFDTYGGKTINYAIGQTGFYSYLPLVLPTYIIAVLYYPLLLITSGFALSIIIDRINNVFKTKNISIIKSLHGKKRLTRTFSFLLLIIVILLLTSQIYYLEPSIKADRNEVFYNNVPPSLENTFNYLNSQNVSGHILEIGNFSNSYGDYSYWPPYTFSPTTGWGANWYPHIVNYFMEHNTSNLANLLKYMGVQYVMYRFSNYTSLTYLEEQTNMELAFHDSSIYLFKNQNYTSQIQSDSLYATYNLPESMSVLSQLNTTYPIIPFYDLLQLSNPYKYISGIIGYNLSDYKLEPLFLNDNNSFSYNIGSMNINNLNGWQQMPVINSGDDIQALAPNKASTLQVQLNAPAGKYQLLIVGGASPVTAASACIGPYDFSANASLKIYSGNSYNNIVLNESNFSPYLNVYEINNFSFAGKDLNIQSFENANGTPFISYIYMIPVSKVGSINNEINQYIEKANIIDYTNNSSGNIITNSNINTNVNVHIPFPTSVYEQVTHLVTNYNTVVSYKDSDIVVFSFMQDAKLNGEILHVGYFYGSGFVYISPIKNAHMIYGDYNGLEFIEINVVSIIVATLYVYIPVFFQKRRGQ